MKGFKHIAEINCNKPNKLTDFILLLLCFSIYDLGTKTIKGTVIQTYVLMITNKAKKLNIIVSNEKYKDRKELKRRI